MTSHPTAVHALGIGKILDRAALLYRGNFIKFVGVIAIVQIPFAVINLLVSLSTYEIYLAAIPEPFTLSSDLNPFSLFSPEYFLSIGINGILTISSLILINGIASGALTCLVVETYLGGDQDELDPYLSMKDRWLTLIKAILLIIGLALVVILWMFVPFLGWATGPGMLLVVLSLVLPLIPAVVVLENFSAQKSIRRTWELTRVHFWRVTGFMIILYLFNQIIVGGPNLVGGFILNNFIPDGFAINNPQTYYNIQVIVQSLLDLTFTLLYVPFQFTCLALLYIDLRVRQEGFDLMFSAGRSGLIEKRITVRQLLSQSTIQPDDPLLTGKELTYFIVISAIVMGLYLAAITAFSLFGMAF